MVTTNSETSIEVKKPSTPDQGKLPEVTLIRAVALLNPRPVRVKASQLTPAEWRTLLIGIMEQIDPVAKYLEGYVPLRQLLGGKMGDRLDDPQYDQVVGTRLGFLFRGAQALLLVDRLHHQHLAIFLVKDRGLWLLQGNFPTEPDGVWPTFRQFSAIELGNILEKIDSHLLALFVENLVLLMEASKLTKAKRFESFSAYADRVSALRESVGFGF